MKKIMGTGACLVGCLFVFWMGPSFAVADPPSPPLDASELTSVTISVGSAYGSASGSSTGIITQDSLHEENVQSMTSLLSSLNANTGIVNLNQASGDLNNQGNVRAIFFSTDPSSAVSLLQLERSVEISNNQIYSSGAIKQDLIQGSLQYNLGIIGINQAAGSLNSQTNTLALAIGGLVTLTDKELGSVSASNTLQDTSGSREDIIRDSFAGSHGIFQVNQSAGDLNVLGNALALSFREINVR
jgi:hypothetical protein